MPSTLEENISQIPNRYTSELVSKGVDRLDERKELPFLHPPYLRLFREEFVRFSAVNMGNTSERFGKVAEEWVRRKVREAEEGVFEDLAPAGIPSPSAEKAIRVLPVDSEEEVTLSTSDLLARLSDVTISPQERQQLVCEAELVLFPDEERENLLAVLWRYIQNFRNSNDCSELIAVGAAIRKYVAVMPMHEMGRLAPLLESGHRAGLPLDLELEVAKMVYRNFEVHPPEHPDPHPELAARLWEMTQAYINPRFLLREKYATVVSLAIEALVAMQSEYAEDAWRSALACPYDWFREAVTDHLCELRRMWASGGHESVAWLDALHARVLTNT